MKVYVADTHALYWYLVDAPQLGPRARVAFEEGERGQARIIVSAVVFAELYYMNEKLGRRLNMATVLAELRAAVQFDILAFEAD